MTMWQVKTILLGIILVAKMMPATAGKVGEADVKVVYGKSDDCQYVEAQAGLVLDTCWKGYREIKKSEGGFVGFIKELFWLDSADVMHEVCTDTKNARSKMIYECIAKVGQCSSKNVVYRFGMTHRKLKEQNWKIGCAG